MLGYVSFQRFNDETNIKSGTEQTTIFICNTTYITPFKFKDNLHKDCTSYFVYKHYCPLCGGLTLVLPLNNSNIKIFL